MNVIARMYSIVIPAYNESQRLGPTLDKVLAFVAEQGWESEILVVNDGSKDNTVEIVNAYSQNYPNVRLVQNPGNRGKGYAVKNGMLHANGDIMLMTDADLSSPIEECTKLFNAIEAGADVAIGSRWIDPSLQTVRQPWFRQIGGRGLNVLIRLILALRFKDTQCGFKAFSRSAAQQLFPLQQVERWGFDPELLFLAKRFGLQTDEVGVHWANDERTKLHPFRDAIRILTDAVQVRRNAIAGKYGRREAATAAASSR
ncbi:MAG: glycosyltransferase family 2 protein [Acidobacteriaceae bacterium]